MDNFLREIEDLSDREAADETGINYESIRLYRLGSWTRLTSMTERRMRAYIERRREERASRELAPTEGRVVVPFDARGHPLQNDVEIILSWLPENMSARWAGEVTAEVRLAQAYAYGKESGWSAARLAYVEDVRKRLRPV